MDNFGRDKTITLVEDHFYWPSLKRDIIRLVSQCFTCQLGKENKRNYGLYTIARSTFTLENFKYEFCFWVT